MRITIISKKKKHFSDFKITNIICLHRTIQRHFWHNLIILENVSNSPNKQLTSFNSKLYFDTYLMT